MDVVGVVPFLPAEHVLHVAHEVPSNVLEAWYCPLSQLEQTRSTDVVGELPFFPAEHLVQAEQVTEAALLCAW